MNWQHRSSQKELLDNNNIPFADIKQNMRELNVINTLLGGHRITLKGFQTLLGKRKQIHVCEIGCGGGDNLLSIYKWCKNNNIKATFTGVDLKEECIQFAKTKTNLQPCTTWIASDYKTVVFDKKPDIIFSSLFCHHFSDEELITQLQWMKENSTIGFFINDLQRHSLAYHSIKILTQLFSKSYLVKNDAPISVMRGLIKKNGRICLQKQTLLLIKFNGSGHSGISLLIAMHNNEDYDIAVIGGGLAGLSLAIQSAEAGYKTVLFEKEQYPFHKVCGEYISYESYPFLQRLGVDLPSLSLPEITKLIVSDASGKAYPFPLDLGGFGISRYTLDNLLYQVALSKGVTIFTKIKVNDVLRVTDGFTINTSNTNYKARVVCSAYGKRSNLDIQWKRHFAQQKLTKLNNFIGIKYHIRYSFPNDTIALHNFENGYCGISKIEDDKYCLCYLTTAGNLKKHNNSIAEMEKNLLSQNQLLKDIFQSANFLYQQPLAISGISFDKKTQVENGVLMLGDTAGLITPLCGNGMSMAMHSSVLAFENIHLFLQQKQTRNEMEKNYTTQWQQQFAKRLFIGRTVQRLFGSNRSTALFLRTMKLFPSLAKWVIKSTHGKAF